MKTLSDKDIRKNPPKELTADERFFYKHAGYSYDPKTQTPRRGLIESAKSLAAAEAMARHLGCSFEWSIDDEQGSRTWTDDAPAWPTWCCVVRNGDGETLGSLYGIDFGRDGVPWGDPYRRIVEAELAVEHVTP